MKREWKPGDVAIATVRGVPGQIVMRRNDPDITWLSCEHPGGTCHHNEAHVEDVRPLVVIDYDDREQVERLYAAWASLSSGFAELMDEPWTMPAMRLRQALREFANPRDPKPDEPTGLGAVVEDADGELWVRDKTTTTRAHWKRARGQEGGKRHPYAAIAVVRVLSKGVSA